LDSVVDLNYFCFSNPKAVCTRHASHAFYERMRLISWRHVLFWYVWHGLRSSRTCFYVGASDSLLWFTFTRTQIIPDPSEKDVTSRNQTHAAMRPKIAQDACRVHLA